MNKNDRLLVVIPAFNEEKSVSDVVGRTVSYFDRIGFLNYDVLVVNDASEDGTLYELKGCRCKVLSHCVNLGIGGSMQTGFIYARDNSYDYVLQVDGDGQHDPEEAGRLILGMDDETDVVVGSRFIENKGFQSSRIRQTGIKFFSFLIRYLTGINVSDVTSGFRLINRKTIDILSRCYPDEYPEPESFVIFWKYGLRVKEVAVVMHERKYGKSSINSIYYMFKVTISIIYSYIKYRYYGKY
mgnify:CR=1 FL=1